MSVSPFDHPVLSALLGDETVAAAFGFDAELAAMLRFEAALARAQATCGLIPQGAAEAIVEACCAFKPDMAALRAACARDGLMVPEVVRQLRQAVGAAHEVHVHFGSTSQDVIDTALILRLKDVALELERRIATVLEAIAALERRFGQCPLIGRTRMQQALPITVGDRLAAWQGPLARHGERLEALRPRLLAVQCGGAVGTLDKLASKGDALARELGRLLDLAAPPRCWHTQRDNLAEFASWLSLVTGALGKIGQDIALMAQNEIGEIALAGGGSSSAMAHKQNPVNAEVLVTLARFNAGHLGLMHQALVHEQERSGIAWTLEWMVLPQMVVATGAALRLGAALLSQVTAMGGR